jgi:hypothetical protein
VAVDVERTVENAKDIDVAGGLDQIGDAVVAIEQHADVALGVSWYG